jgi:hypothetical protein
MIPLRGLHALAAHRGDGLRQEFLELLARREAFGAANIDDISIYLAEHFTQAGPNPVGRIDGEPRHGVVAFPKSVASPHAGKLVLRRSV